MHFSMISAPIWNILIELYGGGNLLHDFRAYNLNWIIVILIGAF
jgi:hypothetical protein